MAIMSFKEDLAKAQAAKNEPKRSDPVAVALGDSLYEVTFTVATPEEWAAVTARHPMRVDQPIDRTYGYNFHAVAAEIAETTGAVTKDGEPVVLVVQKLSRENRNPINEWRDFFAALDGSAYTQLADAVFALNQWEPDQRVAELKKASRPASETSSD